MPPDTGGTNERANEMTFTTGQRVGRTVEAWTRLTVHNPHTEHTFNEEIATDDTARRVTWLIGRGMQIQKIERI